jgi:hypothetical protein
VVDRSRCGLFVYPTDQFNSITHRGRVSYLTGVNPMSRTTLFLGFMISSRDSGWTLTALNDGLMGLTTIVEARTTFHFDSHLSTLHLYLPKRKETKSMSIVFWLLWLFEMNYNL